MQAFIYTQYYETNISRHRFKKMNVSKIEGKEKGYVLLIN